MDQRIPKVEHQDRTARGGGGMVLSQSNRALALREPPIHTLAAVLKQPQATLQNLLRLSLCVRI